MPPPGAAITPLNVPREGFASRVASAARYVISGVSPATWFGPNQPLVPIAPPDVKGRQWDYPTGINLQYVPRGTAPVSFWQLRQLADSLPLLRLVIETRKDQAASLEYMVRPKIAAGSKNKRKIAAADDPASQRVTKFLLKPDGRNSFDVWLRMILEELFVTDAVTLYPRMTRGGGLYSVDLIDGATIKPLIGADGRSPLPPDPAYQQILKGIPAADFTTEELIYAPRNPRVHSLGYGYGPVEQIILTVNIALRRDLSTLDYYNTRTTPDAFGTLPKEWTPDQIRQFQDYFDAMMSGDIGALRRLKFMPSEFKLIESRQIPLKDMYDEWLARLVCYAFSVPISPFVNQVNRATGETLKVQASQEGLQPLKRWIKNVLDHVVNVYMGEPTVEFVFNDEDENDPLEQAQTLVALVGAGIKSRDEARDDLGDEPIPGGEGVEYTVTTGSGVAPISVAAQQELDDAKANTAAALKPPPPVPGAAKPSKGEPVERLAFTKAKGRTVDGPPFERPAVAKAVEKFTAAIAAALLACRESIGKQLGDAPLGKAVSDDDGNDDRDAQDAEIARRIDALDALPEERRLAEIEDISAEIADSLEFSTLETLASDATLPTIASDAVKETVARIGVTMPMKLVNQVDTEAVAIARDRAAEMVGMRVGADGALAPTTNAAYAITDTTREAIRQTIADGLDANLKRSEIIDAIMELGDFGQDRAALIANTEIARINSLATLQSFKGAASLGIDVCKTWLTAALKVCDFCASNARQGPIPLDAPFSSGDDAPPGHPRCRCALSSVVYDGPAEKGFSPEGEGVDKYSPSQPRDAHGRWVGNGLGGVIPKGEEEKKWHDAAFEKANEKTKKIIANTKPLSKIIYKNKNDAYYMPGKHYINMHTYNKDETGNVVFRHEFGHAIDEDNGQISKEIIKSGALSIDRKRLDAIKAPPAGDVDELSLKYKNALDSSSSRENTAADMLKGAPISYADLKSILKLDLNEQLSRSHIAKMSAAWESGSLGKYLRGFQTAVQSNKESEALSTMSMDYIHAASGGRFGAGHDAEYYDKHAVFGGADSGEALEVFANHVAITGNESETGKVYGKLIRAYVPNTWNKTQELIDGLAG